MGLRGRPNPSSLCVFFLLPFSLPVPAPAPAPAPASAGLALGLEAHLRFEGARSFDVAGQELDLGARTDRALARIRPALRVQPGPEERLALLVQPQWYGTPGTKGESSLYQAALRWISPHAELRLGRQEFAFGSTFLLGADTFFDGLAYDGARLTLRRGGAFTADVFGGRYVTAQSGGASGSLAGAWTTWRGRPGVVAEAYAILDTGALPGETVRTVSLGGRVVSPLGSRVTFEVEPVLQRGTYAAGGAPARDVDAYGGRAGLALDLGGISLAAGYALASAAHAGAQGPWTEFRHPSHDIAQVGTVGLVGDLSGVDAGDARASGLRVASLSAVVPVRSARLAIDVHRLRAGSVSGARAKDVGLEVDAALSFALVERLGVTLSASRVRGGAFYGEAVGRAPRVSYAFLGFDFDL